MRTAVCATTIPGAPLWMEKPGWDFSSSQSDICYNNFWGSWRYFMHVPSGNFKAMDRRLSHDWNLIVPSKFLQHLTNTMRLHSYRYCLCIGKETGTAKRYYKDDAITDWKRATVWDPCMHMRCELWRAVGGLQSRWIDSVASFYSVKLFHMDVLVKPSESDNRLHDGSTTTGTSRDFLRTPETFFEMLQ